LNSAPILGDVDAWGARIAKGQALLLQSTIEGIQPAMPPRGMCFSCSDDELAAAVDYMIAESQ
jgi:cytochrome c5